MVSMVFLSGYGFGLLFGMRLSDERILTVLWGLLATPVDAATTDSWLLAACSHFIFEGNLIVLPATMKAPRPWWWSVRGFLQPGSIQAFSTSSTKKL